MAYRHYADQSAEAPRAQVAAVTLDWIPFYKTAVRESFDYLCTKTDTSRGYREGAIKVVGLSKSLSRAAAARLEAVQSALSRGDFQIFSGTIRSNAGAEVLSTNALGEEAWRKSTNFLVRGVTVVPAGKSNATEWRWGRY